MSKDNREREARAQKFRQAAQKRVKVLLTADAPSEKRVQVAKWLGECGLPEVISPLVQVYEAENRKGSDADKELLKAVTFALGQYRAFEQAIDAQPGETLEDALRRNRKLVDQIDNIAQTGQFGKQKSIPGGLLWGIVLLLTISLAALGALNVALMGGGASEPTPTPFPTSTATDTPTLPPNVTPTDTLTPTPSETPTNTPTPTIAPEDIRPYVVQLSSALDQITQPRGTVELLRTFWSDVQLYGDTAGCNTDIPEIPADIFIPEEYLNKVVDLGNAQLSMNVVLGLVRTAWDVFKSSCDDNTLASQAANGAEAVNLIDQEIARLRVLLPDLQAMSR